MPQTAKTYRVRPHPEALEGEVWLTNVIEKDHSFEVITEAWESARLGQTAYDFDGRAVSESKIWGLVQPVFIQRQELEKAGYAIQEPES